MSGDVKVIEALYTPFEARVPRQPESPVYFHAHGHDYGHHVRGEFCTDDCKMGHTQHAHRIGVR